MTIQGLHQGQPILTAGEPLDRAQAAMIMIHGRGATAESILTLAAELNQAGFIYLAPQAAGNTWYPNSFMASIPSNEPGISSGMAVIAGLIDHLTEGGIPAERTMLLGFSQGACLASEFILGCSDVDFHIPKERVELSAEVLRRLGGEVTMRLYPGMGHLVNQDEINFVRQMMAALIQ
ncbi:MAG: phospholipase [Chloroflexi bacterium]|nr:phospholipase [Chloroflexota bacterium]